MRFDSHSVTTHCTAIMHNHKPQRSRLFSVRRRPRRTGSSRHAQDTSSVAGLLVTLGALSVTLRAFVTATRARARRLRAAKRARPYSPLSLSHVAFPLLSQSHIPSYEPRETPAFPCKCERPPCKCERPPATLSAPSREAIKAPHMQPFNPPSFAYVLMRGHHVHFVDTPPPPRVRRTSGCSPRPRVLLAGPNGRPIGRPAPCT